MYRKLYSFKTTLLDIFTLKSHSNPWHRELGRSYIVLNLQKRKQRHLESLRKFPWDVRLWTKHWTRIQDIFFFLYKVDCAYFVALLWWSNKAMDLKMLKLYRDSSFIIKSLRLWWLWVKFLCISLFCIYMYKHTHIYIYTYICNPRDLNRLRDMTHTAGLKLFVWGNIL